MLLCEEAPSINSGTLHTARNRSLDRLDLFVECPSFGFEKFPDMLCMKRVYRDKAALFHWSETRNKDRFSSR